MDSMPCITCQRSLRDNGKITPDWQWAYCNVCGARYEIIAAVDEQGHPMMAPDGHQKFYLNPVAHGDPQYYKEPDEVYEQEQVPHDFDKLKNVIANTDTVNAFIQSLKRL